MARGWESKAVEEQQAAAASQTRSGKVPLTPQQQVKAREREGLLLSRKRVLQQLAGAQNSSRRSMLEQALAELDERLRASASP